MKKLLKNLEEKPVPLMLDESLLPEEEVNPELVNRIKQYENSIKKGYDPETDTWKPHQSIEGGAPTLAYGDKLLPNKYDMNTLKRVMSQGISSEEADRMLIENIKKSQEGAKELMRMHGIEGLDPVQQEALAEMVFQMGKKGTSDFKNMMNSLKNKDFKGAYLDALDSKWAEQTPQRAIEVAQRLRFGKLKNRLKKKVK